MTITAKPDPSNACRYRPTSSSCACSTRVTTPGHSGRITTSRPESARGAYHGEHGS
jgi:hypothetical protein